MGRWHVLREPTVPILLLASVVHVVRRDLFDFMLFSGTAALIVADSRRSPAAASPDRRGAPPGWLQAAVVVLGASVLALAPPASVAARGAVMACGLIAVAVVMLPADSRRGLAPSAPLRGWGVWATIGVLTCLWELSSFIAGQLWPDDGVDHPAVTDLIGPQLTGWSGRAIFLMIWLAAGWWLVSTLLTAGRAPGQAPDETPGRAPGVVLGDTPGAAAGEAPSGVMDRHRRSADGGPAQPPAQREAGR